MPGNRRRPPEMHRTWLYRSLPEVSRKPSAAKRHPERVLRHLPGQGAGGGNICADQGLQTGSTEGHERGGEKDLLSMR